MIETKSAFISKIDEDTLKIIFKPNAYLRTEEYQGMYEHYRSLLKKEKEMKLLIIIQEGFQFEKKYMDFFKNVFRTDFKKAEAYVILHPFSKMFFKVGVKMLNNRYPLRIFDHEKEALNWLKEIK